MRNNYRTKLIIFSPTTKYDNVELLHSTLVVKIETVKQLKKENIFPAAKRERKDEKDKRWE